MRQQFVKTFEEDVRNPFRVSCKIKRGGTKYAELEFPNSGCLTVYVPDSVRWAFSSMKEYFRSEAGQQAIEQRRMDLCRR